MKPMQEEPNTNWQPTPYANLIRYVPSHTYFARIRIRGKLIRKSLKTDSITVAKLRLADLEKDERQAAEHRDVAITGKMTFGDCLRLHSERLQADPTFKPKTKEYYEYRIKALFKSWPGLKEQDVRKITKSDCLNWAVRFRREASSSSFNHTVSLMRRVFEVGIEAGARYDNPARFIKGATEHPKQLRLPEPDQFDAFVKDRPDNNPNSPVMRVRECQKAMDRAAKVVGMERITHHDLRHLFATRCIESGVDVPTVSRWLGHRDGGALAMRTYGHLRDLHSSEMAQKVTFQRLVPVVSNSNQRAESQSTTS